MAAILFISPAKTSSVVCDQASLYFRKKLGRLIACYRSFRISVIVRKCSAFIFPVQVKYGRDRNAETKTKIEGQLSSFNILRKRKTKNGNDYQNSLSKVVGKKNENRRLEFHFQCSRKTENENGISNSFFR